ncbi:MAG: hypothetical protein EHM48_07955, partial [Planctomycetaceae bacterium]
MMERSNLVRNVIQAATEYHKRQLWKRFTNFDCFGIRVPGKDDLLLACVMGDAGEEYGLMLFQGPHAPDNFLAVIEGEAMFADAMDNLDMLSFSMGPFGEMLPQEQAFFREAGIHPRQNELVPFFITKQPGRQLRTSDKKEQALLLTILKAVVIADQQKLLYPSQLSDDKGICVITLGGDMAEPTVSASREKLPPRPMPAKPPVTPISPFSLSGLKLIDEEWLVGTPSLAAKISDDDRSMQLLLVVDDATGKILQSRPFFSEEIQEAIDAVVEAFRGKRPKGQKGIPRTITFTNRRLYDAMSQALEDVGAECDYTTTMIPELQDMADGFSDFMSQGVPSGEHMPILSDADDEMPAPDDLD